MIHFIDRLKGCIIGLALGDAFGAPFEFFTRQDILHTYKKKVTTFVKNDGPFVKNGEYTDDTQMALGIINAIIEDGTINPETVKNKFVEWYNTDPPDVGITTSTMLKLIIRSGNEWKKAIELYGADVKNYQDSASNGSLMRCAPIGVFHYNNMDSLINDSIEISKITHYDPRCTYSNVALNYLIAKNIQRENKTLPISHIDDLDKMQNLITTQSPQVAAMISNVKRKILLVSSRQATFEEVASEYCDKGGYVLDTFAIALLSFYCTTSYKDALIEAVNFGGDTDTNGAVLGALAGSYYGMENLPKEWLSNMKQLKSLIDICNLLYNVIKQKSRDLP